MREVLDDAAEVAALLGRTPRGRFEVVVRDGARRPLVIRNAPLLDDGTPMPTRYWLVGEAERQAVSRLEAGGGVARAGRRRAPGGRPAGGRPRGGRLRDGRP